MYKLIFVIGLMRTDFCKLLVMKLMSLSLVCTLSVGVTVSASSKPLSVDTAAALQSAVISYKMVDLETGSVVASRNSSKCATPASVTKLITTATALELLGPDFTFDTYIETDGVLQPDGTLDGNLIIRGGADPTLGSVFLGNRNFISVFASAIQRYGIRRITGNVIAYAGCLDNSPVPLKWSWEDIGHHYGAGAYGLSAYDNTSIITLKSGRSGTRPQIISIWPELPDMHTVNEITVPLIPNDSVVVFCSPYSRQRILQGCMSAGRNNYVVKASISNPPLLVAVELYRSLADRGINIGGKAMTGASVHASTDTIYTNRSHPLSDIIRLTNFKSNNLYAELTFRRLGNPGNLPVSATSAMSVAAVKRFWKGKGVDISSMFLYDGCGLAPQNSFNAGLLTDILVYMSKSPNWQQFYNSLPAAGKEGTVCGLLRGTVLEGKAKVKSGSISGVQCYSGYIMPDSGRRYAFTVMVNDYACSRRDIRKIIEYWLVRDAR